MSPTKHGNVLSWASLIDDGTIRQAETAARMPFIAGHLALMPDAHVGKGATIGSVIPTAGAVMPAAVGVDLGCGMIAGPLGITADQLPDNLGPLHGAIRTAVPAGMGKGHEPGGRTESPRLRSLMRDAPDLAREQGGKVASQFGTLGGGNHFVEISLDEAGNVWLVLHSGSRGIGNQLANEHIAKAKGLMKQMFVSLEDPDLAYLVEGTPEFDAYIHAMQWAQEYAWENRIEMWNAVVRQLHRLGLDVDPLAQPAVNCHHNYCTREHHHGRNVWVTRKGAISAREGQFGIIPGSMGTDTYIVRGLGNPASYTSAAHGAGRLMSRGQARRELTVESLNEAMEGKVWNDRQAKEVLDEHPKAYKPIETVMRDQADLVERYLRLEQIVSYKGTN